MSAAVAAIDCGSNSTRLLVSRGGEALERRMVITRLGQGVDESGRLADEAIDRVIDCFREFRLLMDAHGVEAIRMTATSAARDAVNRDELFDRAEDVVGVRPELLSGDEEGRLAFAGATAELDPSDGPFLVVDIGGGSTEFSFGTTECEATHSADIGCVRLTERYIHHDPPLPEELHACLAVTEAHLDDVVRLIPAALRARTLVGLAGTVSAAAAVEIGLAEYDRSRIHHFHLTRAAMEDVFRTLAGEDRDQRASNPGLEPGRVDIIVAGMCELARVVRYFDFDSCLVSESDILDGLVASMVDGDR